MIEQKPVFFSKKKGLLFFKGIPYCDFCSKKILDPFILGIFHNKKKTDSFNYCSSCIDKNELNAPGREYLLVNPCKNLPKDGIPFIIQSMKLSNYAGDVFEAVSIKSDFVIDRTRFAGRNDWKGATIGMSIDDVKELERDTPLDTGQLLTNLKDIKESKPITYEDKPLIEMRKTEENKNGKRI